MSASAMRQEPAPEAAQEPAQEPAPFREPHGIGWAIEQIEAGRRVRRAATPRVVWFLDDHGLLVEVVTTTNYRNVAMASPVELMAKDWELAE